jgi:hypothetical protein
MEFVNALKSLSECAFGPYGIESPGPDDLLVLQSFPRKNLYEAKIGDIIIARFESDAALREFVEGATTRVWFQAAEGSNPFNAPEGLTTLIKEADAE